MVSPAWRNPPGAAESASAREGVMPLVCTAPASQSVSLALV
jgi:hypothetical protein